MAASSSFSREYRTMAMLRLGPARRDLEGQYDFFVISSDDLLTAATNSPVPEGWNPVPRLILSTVPDESDSLVLRRLISLLLHRSRPNDRAPVDNIVVLNEHTVQVNGSWLNTGLLRHWIGQLFESDADVQVVHHVAVLEPNLVPA